MNSGFSFISHRFLAVYLLMSLNENVVRYITLIEASSGSEDVMDCVLSPDEVGTNYVEDDGLTLLYLREWQVSL
jgi:hypothetical protein